MKRILFTVTALWVGQAAWAAVPVTASFSILGDVARQIGGERITVQTLVGPDQDAHVYQLTSRDVQKIRSARLVLLHGLGFERADVQRAVAQSKVKAVTVTRGIPTMAPAEEEHHDDHHGHDHGDVDPHLWHDPVLMQRYAQNVTDALIQADPAGRAYYTQRLQAYQTELKQLDAWAKQSFANIPVAQRKVLTAHEGFAYLGKRYQIRFIAPQGMSTDAQASAKTVAAIVRQIRQDKIKAVFFENIKDERLLTRIGKEAGVSVRGQLYSDALSQKAGAPKTYAELFRYNVTQLAAAMK